MLSAPALNSAALPILGALVLGLAVISGSQPSAARDRSKDEVEAPAPTLNGRAALAVVSIKDQRISLYDSNGGAVRGRISSGQTTYETPVGVFSILQKKEEHYSNLYDDASMPFMQRITWSGVALHAGALPGYPASHGCVRLPHEFAERIFPMTKLGMRVVISKHDIAPINISHDLLFKPEPISDVTVATPAIYEPAGSDDDQASINDPDVRGWPARQALLETLRAARSAKLQEARTAVAQWDALKENQKKYSAELALIAKRNRAAEVKSKAEARVTRAEKTLAGAKTSRAVKRAEKEKADATTALSAAEAKLAEATKAAEEADKIITKLNDEIAALEKLKTAALEALTEAKRKTMPISVFVSLKAQKLYVRQGNEPVFETPVTISNADLPIGTHVFTALDYANDGNDVRWNVVTIALDPARDSYENDDWDDRPRNRKRKDRDRNYTPPVTDAAAAAAALERVSIPADARERIAKYVWPGSSLIISDEELSKETGKATDFIVVASDEPHGALAKRKRQPPTYFRDYYDDGYYYYSYRPNYRYDRRRPPRNKGFFTWW